MPLDAGGVRPYNAPVPASHEAPARSASPLSVRGLRLLGLTLLCSLLVSGVAAHASEVHFSPNGGIRQRLVRGIQTSQRTIDVAMYSFTAAELAEALYAATARGVRVRVLVDRERAESGGSGIRGLRLN